MMIRVLISLLFCAFLHGADEIYMLTLQVKDSSWSLSISEHIKNKMNAVKFDIQTTKEYYDQCVIGQTLTSDFKTGSFIYRGAIKSTKVTILDKKILKPE